MKKEREEEISKNIFEIENLNCALTKDKIENLFKDLKNNKDDYLKVIRKAIKSYTIDSSYESYLSTFSPSENCGIAVGVGIFAFIAISIIVNDLSLIPLVNLIQSFIFLLAGYIFTYKRCAAKLFINLLNRRSAKQKYYEYEQMLTNALNYINSKEEQINDNFIKEILDTINTIKLNSYPNCKEELSSLQALSKEYLKCQNESNSNIVLTLDNKQEELKSKLNTIKEKVKLNQSKYRVAYVIEELNNRVNNKTNSVKENKPQTDKIDESILKENLDIKYLGSLEMIDDLATISESEFEFVGFFHKNEILDIISDRVNHHKLLYSILAYFRKIDTANRKEPYSVSGATIALSHLIVFGSRYIITYFITRNISLGLLVALTSCYIPHIIEGYKELKDKYIRFLKSWKKTQEEENKPSKELEKTKVDSFIKDIMKSIEYIQNNPYKNCEDDIKKLKQLATDYVEYIHRSPSYKPNLELNAETKDFYGREYAIESSFSKSQINTKETLIINKSIKDALENPIIDNSIIENDIFVKDVFKVVNLIKTNNYENYTIELQEICTITADYINYAYCSGNKPSYEEFTKKVQEFYAKLLLIIDQIETKQTISGNLTEIDDLVTRVGSIKLDTDLDLDVNKLELKLK